MGISIDFAKLNSVFQACRGRVGYLLGAKCKLDAKPEDIRRIDCSGWVRYHLYQATGIKLPDGSQNQLAWARKNLRKLAKYSDVQYAAADGGRLFIAFLSPKPGEEWPRHVWLLKLGVTMESCSSQGVASRNWDHPSLRFCKECFEIA